MVSAVVVGVGCLSVGSVGDGIGALRDNQAGDEGVMDGIHPGRGGQVAGHDEARGEDEEEEGDGDEEMMERQGAGCGALSADHCFLTAIP